MHFRFVLFTVLLALGLLLGMLVFMELGRRLGVRHVAKRGPEVRAGVGKVDGVVYAVLALLIGFVFSGATTRFDYRRELVIKEVNAISTAWQRIDALPFEAQSPIRDGFRRYVDALLLTHANVPGSGEEVRAREQLRYAQNDIWQKSMVASTQPSGEKARMLLLPAINEMFVVVGTERLAQRMHPPAVIFVMLGLAALAGAIFSGYGLATAPTRNWLHILGVAATISVTIYVIIELEYPRVGLIRADTLDHALFELRANLIDPAVTPPSTSAAATGRF